MPISPEDLEKRLAEADRIRQVLRKATRDMQNLGDEVREARRRKREQAGDGPR